MVTGHTEPDPEQQSIENCSGNLLLSLTSIKLNPTQLGKITI